MRPPRRAGGRPDLRVDDREGAGSWAGAGVSSGLGCFGSGSFAAGLMGDLDSWSDSASSKISSQSEQTSRQKTHRCDLPSPFCRSDLPFLRFAASGSSTSGSSGSFVSLSRWPREAARCRLTPLGAGFGFESSSETGWDAGLLFETAPGEGELVRCRLVASLCLEPIVLACRPHH